MTVNSFFLAQKERKSRQFVVAALSKNLEIMTLISIRIKEKILKKGLVHVLFI